MPHTPVSFPRYLAASAVEAIALCATIYVLWSIVPFFRGDLGEPSAYAIHCVTLWLTHLVNQFFSLPVAHGTDGLTYYASGFIVWTGLSSFMIAMGYGLSRTAAGHQDD
ncbi:hypothetical protein ACFSHT_29030 [Paraburkholderia silviterrae]|uniref:Uncharacterized protein n=1 Tax=Paraburkholderia silviterrae TaxID=2528715 RepID=A0A4R5M5I7_9BURK|nr:hypothetical protein [Paraburkholderia silviterrae]TDG21129.1 hypothetical protein EYW47_22425 [Paraburkholderia silviterrae]